MDRYVVSIPPPLAITLAPSVRVLMVCPATVTEAEVDTLHNIVKACGLELGVDCDIARVAGSAAVGTSSLPQNLRWVVSFGFDPAELGLRVLMVPYAWTAEIGGRVWCFAERLQLVGEDLDRKRRLWSTIKSLKAIG